MISKTVIKCSIADVDGLSDIDIPISYFSAQIESSGRVIVSISIPTMESANDIADRSNGNIVLSKNEIAPDGSIISTEICRSSISKIQTYEGPKSQSIVLQAGA